MFKDNAFKYISSNEGKGGGGGLKAGVNLQLKQKDIIEEPQYVNTPPQRPKFVHKETPQPPKQRVIVRQGDKRVPAAKRQPKKRKAVTPDDENTLSMDSIEWSNVTYNVTSLIRMFSENFPLLVKVTKGYNGAIGTPLAIGQVLQVHSTGRQQRVLLADAQGVQYSMPVDYPMEVNVLEQGDRVWMKLRDVILSRSLPLRVRVMTTLTEAESASRRFVGQDLHVRSLREDVFLRGNHINHGWIDQTDILHLPAFMDATFVVAENMRGASRAEWGDYSGMYRRSVRHLNFSLLTGYTGVYLEGAMPEPLVADDTPSSRHRSPAPTRSQPLTSADVYVNLPSNERKRDSQQNFYDNHTFSTADEGPVIAKQEAKSEEIDIFPQFGNSESFSQFGEQDILPHFDNHETYKATKNESDVESRSPTERQLFVVEPELHPPPRAETPFSDVEDEDVESMFDNVIRVGQETLEKQRREEREEENRRLEKENKFKRQQETQKRLREEELERERKRIEKEKLEDALKREEALRNTPGTADEDDVSHRLRKESEERERIARDALVRREREETKRRLQHEQRLSHVNTATLPSASAEIRLDEDTVHYTNHIEASKGGVRRQNSTKDEVFYEQQAQSVSSILNKIEGSSNSISPDEQTKKTRPASRSGSRSGPRGSYISETSSGTPVGVIQPTILQRKESLKDNANRKLSTSRDDATLRSSIKTMEDVPDRTSKLTVGDVCQCLKLLNMDVHIPEFKKNQVDGNTLGELKEATLMSEFHFTPFNASKLMRFSRGWRPKLA